MQTRRLRHWLVLALGTLVLAPSSIAKKGRTAKDTSPLDRYVQEANQRAHSGSGASPGSLYSPGSRLGDIARDPRAGQIDDIITIVVSDRASAVTTGTTNTSRKSSATGSITSLIGPKKATGPLVNLADLSSNQQLQGQGTTTRGSTVTTTLSARVIAVLPNGNLVVEGVKEIAVNSERQTVIVRGVLRPNDLTAANTIPSDRLTNLEVRINGKGVVGDSVRRPFILYRILLGLLPF